MLNSKIFFLNFSISYLDSAYFYDFSIFVKILQKENVIQLVND